MFCKKCNKIVYVGETGVTLYQRHVLNLSLIRRETNDPVAMHFYTDEHTVEDYSVIGIEKLYKDETYRKFRENLWKTKLILICLLVSTKGNKTVFRLHLY